MPRKIFVLKQPVHAQAEMLSATGFFLGDAEADRLRRGDFPKAPQHTVHISDDRQEHKQHADDPKKQGRGSIFAFAHIEADIFKQHAPKNKRKRKSENTA